MHRSVIALALLLSMTACSDSRCTGDSTGSDDSVAKPKSLSLPGYWGKPSKHKVMIFVHGIWGDGWGTWFNRATGTYWPRMVAEDPAFNEFDVFVYQYDTRVVERTVQIPDLLTEMHTRLKAADVLSSHDEVIFVAHSMGGLLVRQLLLDYRQELAGKVHRLFFFATPSLGSPKADTLGHLVTNVTAKGLQPIDANSFLLQQQDSWLAAKFGITSYCGFETTSTAGLQIVPRASAEALCTEPSQALPGSHLDAAKPRDQSAIQHVALRAALMDAVPAPVKGPPKMETRWFRSDQGGQEYRQVFVQRTENRHGRPDIVASGTSSIAVPDARIYRVDYSCVGFPCGWSYNPDGGYGGKVVIQGDGKSFLWWRRWDGDPCDDVYTAYYEVSREVCVENCPQ